MIKEYIKTQVLLPRVNQSSVLVVYDPERRYRELCHELGSSELCVVDAGERGIESREAAMECLQGLSASKGGPSGLLVYVPAKAPVTDEEKQRDPFSLYAACGALFPQGDADEYMNICVKAKPDHGDAIRKIFQGNPNPPFGVIDAVGGGVTWPILQSLLKSTSASEILQAILVPDAEKKAAIEKSTDWIREAKEFFKAVLGMELKTRLSAWSAVADELWRFILFSEFVFDLPGDLPPSLATVPRAPDTAMTMIYDICDRLRNDRRVQAEYIERATAIEQELDLPLACNHHDDLGDRDTFPFEEKTFIKNAIKSIREENIDKARAVIDKHSSTVWAGNGDSQAKWGLLTVGMKLIERCNDIEPQIGARATSVENIIDLYVGYARETDRLHREFEQSLSDYIDAQWLLNDIIEIARDRYRMVLSALQRSFIKNVEASGWPPANLISNADVFDKLLKGKLEKRGNRIAFLHIDALRYELGIELEKQLKEDGTVELKAAYAALPTITKVGMAGLLPGAGALLNLKRDDRGLKVFLGDTAVENVTQRMDIYRKTYGDRFAEMSLSDFVKNKKKIDENVDILVIRSVEIDSLLTDNAESTLRLIHETLKKIRVALYKLKAQGFKDAVIATDHGFILNAGHEAGDVCQKPNGNWAFLHDRCVIGEGPQDEHNIVFQSAKLGIRCDFPSFGTPRGLVPYKSGMNYFHGGLSLQEAIVPVLHAVLGVEAPTEERKNAVTIDYKSGSKKITTRLPVVDVSLVLGDLFALEKEFEILLEAHDPNGDHVGEAKSGGPVNAATGTISLKHGQHVQVTMRMLPDYHGKVIIKALNPTTLFIYNTLNLETDYVV